MRNINLFQKRSKTKRNMFKISNNVTTRGQGENIPSKFANIKETKKSPKPGTSFLKPGPLSYKRKVLGQLSIQNIVNNESELVTYTDQSESQEKSQDSSEQGW